MHNRASMIFTVAAAALAAGQQLEKVGVEFRVNTATADDQQMPSVCGLADGGYLVGWSAPTGVLQQRYDAASARVGEEVLVSTVGDNPSVACTEDGGWVVAWQETGNALDVKARRFAPDGTPVAGGVLSVNQPPPSSLSSDDQFSPAAVAFPSGGFAVCFHSGFATIPFTLDTWCTVYGADGSRGSQFRANTATTGPQRNPAVAALPGGVFVAVWASQFQDGSPFFAVYGRLFDTAGAPVGPEFRVSELTTSVSNGLIPAVAALPSPSGGFVAVWERIETSRDVYARVFDSSGVAVTGDVKVNQQEVNDQRQPVVAATASGFVVSWTSDSSTPSGHDIKARGFDRSAVPTGDETVVNTFVSDTQDQPALSPLLNGELAAVWTSELQDGSGAGVFGQRLRVCIAVPGLTPVRVAGTSLDAGAFSLFKIPDAYREAGFTAWVPPQGGLPAATPLSLSCCGSGEDCTFVVAFYHCPPCSGDENGGFPLILPATGFASVRCSPVFELPGEQQTYRMASFSVTVRAGDTLVLPPTARPVSFFTVFEAAAPLPAGWCLLPIGGFAGPAAPCSGSLCRN